MDEALDITLMRGALLQAEEAMKAGEVPIGAVVVRDGALVGTGQNRTRRDLVVHAHAELIALGEAERAAGDYRLTNCTLYVTVEPCLMCLGALLQARIMRLVYGAPEPKFGALTSRFALQDHQALRKLQIVSGVLASEAVELMSAFFNKLRSDT